MNILLGQDKTRANHLHSFTLTVDEWGVTENDKRSKNTLTSSIIHQSMLCVRLGVLELFAVSQGVIGIKGVYSNRFLAMNKRGRLHATVSIPAHFFNCFCLLPCALKYTQYIHTAECAGIQHVLLEWHFVDNTCWPQSCCSIIQLKWLLKC